MKDSRQDIERRLDAARARAAERIAALHDRISLTEYRALVKTVDGSEVWSDALQRALDEH